MRRLDGFSAFMIYNDVPRCYQHTLKIAILDWSHGAGEYSYERLIQRLEHGLTIFPMLRWKLARVPFGLNHPVWVEELNFSLRNHVRRIACPAPGDKSAFCRLVSELYPQTLDKTRPLWLTYVVEGLENGRVALVTLLHHAYADGAGAGLLLQGLVKPENFPPVSSCELGVDPHRNPGRLTLLLRGLVDLPVLFVRGVPRVVRAQIRLREKMRDYQAKQLPMPANPKDAPDSPLNTIFTHGRTFAFESFDLPEFGRTAKQFGVTLNDLLLAVVAGAIARVYAAKGLNADKPIVAGVPFNMRNEQQRKEVLGNYVTTSFMWLPIHVADPRERLRQVSESTGAMKAFMRATGGAGLVDAVELLPPFVADLINAALQRAKGQLKLFGNLAVSNVRGPAEAMHVGTAKIVEWISIGQLLAGIGVNVTAWSYVDKLTVSLMADAGVIGDGPEFMGYLRDAYREFRSLPAEHTPAVAGAVDPKHQQALNESAPPL